MEPIKLGMIRADTHGYYYGAMLDDCDPLLLAKHNYVVHHYASNIYDPRALTFPRVEGIRIVRIWDSDGESARRFSETFRGTPRVCASAEEVADGADAVFIADCNGGGGDHLALARPFLQRGIPTFVDKPFASTLRDAGEIVRLAEEHRTPLFSASILTYVPAALHFRNRISEIDHVYWPVPAQKPSCPVGLGVVKGVGGAFSQELGGKPVEGGAVRLSAQGAMRLPAQGIEQQMAYIIHGVALGLTLFGEDVEWVEAMGSLPLEYLHLHMASGREVLILNTSTDSFPETCSFYASAYGKYGAAHSPPIGDPEFIGGAQRILEMFADMVRTGASPVSYDRLVAPIAVVEAGQLAQKKGARVYIRDLDQR